jgi:dynein heavy chain
MTKATIEIYHTIESQMLPTPSRVHYLFNLRDISKVFQGLLRANREYFDSRDSIMRLWVHEVARVFHDRLIDTHDRDVFHKLVDDKLINLFGSSLKILCPDRKMPIFGDFLSENTDVLVYEEISDIDQLKKFMEAKMVEYNLEPGFIQINLVLFNDAVGHICRIARILRQQNGHALLVGVGGSGRQSLTRLASYIVDIEVFMIKISKQYRHTEFREDLKTLYRQSGVEGKPTTFLFTDTQIVNISFLEDLNNILSSGDVSSISFINT